MPIIKADAQSQRMPGDLKRSSRPVITVGDKAEKLYSVLCFISAFTGKCNVLT